MPLSPGARAPVLRADTILGQPVCVPDAGVRWVHLQFRRFAGCPVCNFHLLTMARRQQEIAAAGVRQVVLFHASREEMLKYQAQLPLHCVADPHKRWYRAYGVETSWRALLHPGVLVSGGRWVLGARRFYRKAENGILGLPADFLIDAHGRIAACHYGTHADDQWEVDELLRLARAGAPGVAPGTVPQPGRG
ncbi:MAG: redoxin domain-containing protein [Burkholderiales bacterium]|nr:redoxin domain-containing protein [Burkholderiales bacterium]